MSNAQVSRWLERIELGLYRRASRVVTVTESFRRNLVARNVPAAKVVTIPNGADLEFWHPRDAPSALRQELGINGAFVVLYLGTHGISHGLDAVLQSAALLRDRGDIRFVFVGDGSAKSGLVEQARSSGLGNVRFLDSVTKEQARDFYAVADVCLVPLKKIKLFESFIPSKMFEIMAMGKPVVGAVEGEAAEILRRSEGAIVVEPEDYVAISAALTQLQSNAARCRSLGAAGRRFVVEKYGRGKLAGAYIRVLQEAIEEGTGV